MHWNSPLGPSLADLWQHPQSRLLFLCVGCVLCGLLCYALVRQIQSHVVRHSWRGRLTTFWVGGEDRMETLGQSLLGRMSDPQARHWNGIFAQQRRWLELEGETASLPRMLGGAAVILAIGGLGLLWQMPVLLALGGVGAVYPFMRQRSKVQRIQKRTERALPELLTLMAAEMAAGIPAERALQSAAAFGGPLSGLIRLAMQESRQERMPLFGRAHAPGTWRRVVDRYQLASLRAFAIQIEIAARKGTAGPELMASLSRSIILSYKDQALREVEKFESKLAVPSVLFFFLPLMVIVMTPLILPLMKALA